MQSSTSIVMPPAIPTNTFRSLGPVGPTYQVLGASYPLDNGDWMIKIRLIETGEEAEYRYTHMLKDPEAH